MWFQGISFCGEENPEGAALSRAVIHRLRLRPPDF